MNQEVVGSNLTIHPILALVLELVVMAVLEAAAERCEGSSPSRGTITFIVQWIERSATNREIGVRVTLRVQMPL